jgi:hypothetical protein
VVMAALCGVSCGGGSHGAEPVTVHAREASALIDSPVQVDVRDLSAHESCPCGRRGRRLADRSGHRLSVCARTRMGPYGCAANPHPRLRRLR